VTPEEAPRTDDVESSDGNGVQRERLKFRLRGKVVPALWVAAVVVSIAALLFSYFKYWPDRQTYDSAAESAMSGAADGAVAVFSYASDTFDRDVSSARTHLTGDFLSQYDQYIRDAVAPIAQMKAVKTTATVTRKAVSELHPDWAEVLLFMNQNTITADNPGPTMAARSVKVKLLKVDGKWLISQLNPV